MTEPLGFKPQYPPLGDVQSPPPYVCQGSELRVFPLDASAAPLQTICDDYLNSIAMAGGLGASWAPLTTLAGGSLVYLLVCTYKKLFNEDSPYRELGYATQSEVLFTFPVVRLDASMRPVKIEQFTPFCAVTNDWSMITGREVLGYPKVLCSFGKLPKKPQQASPIEISASVLSPYAVDSRQRQAVVLDIPGSRDTPKAPPAPEKAAELWPFGSLMEIFERDGLRPVSDELLALLRESVGEKSTTVAFKQFRDPQTPDRATLQGLVTFDTIVDAVAAAGYLKPEPITLNDYDSLPLRQRLGLRAGRLEPILPFWYEADFRLTDAEDLLTLALEREAGRRLSATGGGMLERTMSLWGDAWCEQLEQWTEAMEKLAGASYGVGDAASDVERFWRRAARLGVDLVAAGRDAFGGDRSS